MEAEEIKALRMVLGLTQAALAAKLNVDSVTVSRWENGHKKPHRESVRKMQRLIKKIGRMRLIKRGS